MIEEGIEKYGYLAAARKSSLMTQGELAEKMGCGVSSLVELEKRPDEMTISQLGKVYQLVGVDGKVILEKLVNDFLCPC